MRLSLLTLALLLSVFSLKAQHDLSGSPQKSPLVYAWRISDREALYLYQHDMKNWEKKNLHQLVDSFPSDQLEEPALPTGNYLFVTVKDTYLSATLRTIGALRFDLLNNGPSVSLLLHTPTGELVPDATVEVRGRRVVYDPGSASYALGHWKKSREVKVVHKDALYFFPVTRETRHRYGSRRHYSRTTRYEDHFYSFVAFSKPKYKPGDTVEGKAFILDRRKHPVNQVLALRIHDTVIAHIQPYRPGGYSWSFVLDDSLGLDLDEKYDVTLEDLAGIKNDDEDERDKRKVLARGQFGYEDYDLQSIHFEARADHETQGPGEKVSLLVKATDENDLPVPDGRVEIEVGSDGGASHFQRDSVFLPNTLWTWSQPMDPVGETRIILPDSIFPAASFDYTVTCTFLNSNNERHEQYLHLHHLGDTGRIVFGQRDDSLDIRYTVNGHSQTKPATLVLLADDAPVETRALSLPATLAIRGQADSYEVTIAGRKDSITESYTVEDRPPLPFGFVRTRDSLHFRVQDPWAIPFWYTLTAGNSILAKGYARDLDYRRGTSSTRPYLLRIQYIWQGKVRKEDHWMSYMEKMLKVDIQEPSFVYPGQKAKITVGVHDASGRPVAGADLTAWSQTARFTDYRYPYIPYTGKKYPYRRYSDYTKPKDQDDPQDSKPLDWRRWGAAMGLDTIEYYKFLNPATVYYNVERARDFRTQLAPFVSRKGQLQPVHLIYIDEKLVFSSLAQQVVRYSFPVAPGRHSLRLRIKDKEIRLDSVNAAGGMKTFICINDDSANRSIRAIRKPDTLTLEEKLLLNGSMLLLERNFGDNFATLSQTDHEYLVNAPGSSPGKYGFLVGPLSDNGASLRVSDGWQQYFEPEGGYLFHVEPGLVKEKQWPAFYPFRNLPASPPARNLHDQTLVRWTIDSLWQEYVDERSATRDLYRNQPVYSTNTGRLKIGELRDTSGKAVFVKKVFLFRYDDPDYMRIYKGMEKDLGNLEAGVYRLMLLLKGDRYYLQDSVRVRANGLNYYGQDDRIIQFADGYSRHIGDLLRKMEKEVTQPEHPEASALHSAFNEFNATSYSFMNQASGKVMDKDGHPLNGVTVMLKGTKSGTVTDENGKFHLNVTARGTLVFAYVGYQTQESAVQSFGYYDIRLSPITGALDDVVVIGYGIQTKRELSSVMAYGLEGNVAGLFIPDAIRQDTVVIPAIEAPMTGSTIRRHFRDNAFWQPRLRTDAEGKASFTVQYPDDITSWRTFAAAFTDGGYSGLAQGRVRAFKPLSAALSLPSFLVTGDRAGVIGKLLNYGPDTVNVMRSFSVDGGAPDETRLRFLNSHIDTFRIQPQATDSMHLIYSLDNGNGYTDGEDRTIPVFPAGTKETKGRFAVLEGDTAMTMNFDTTQGPVHCYATASLLPVLLDEIERLKSYEYFCNEQLASKLIALLQKKTIYRMQKKPFEEDKNINDLIDRLLKARRSAVVWGWWPEAPASAWVSLHVTEALLMARKEGYSLALDKQPITDWLVSRLENDSVWTENLFRLRLLGELDAHIDYKKYIDNIEKRLKIKSLYTVIHLQQLRQLAGLPTRLDTLIPKRHYTAMGNCYWGEDGIFFFDNAVQNTVGMYRLLRKEGGHGDLLKRIRGWLLEQRATGHWRNTYESSLILETILPDLLEDGRLPKPSVLRVNGQTVDSFPYAATLPPGQPLSVEETGVLPVYFTAYQQFFNSNPGRVDGVFAVTSWFGNGDVNDRLRTGVPVTLEVQVDVKGDADYVMIEVPIPAGCTYQDKDQAYGSYEIHREYFKNKLSIFCLHLDRGRQRFTISLLPRYTGTYHLNPAKAELMYFPVLHGREALRTVKID